MGALSFRETVRNQRPLRSGKPWVLLYAAALIALASCSGAVSDLAERQVGSLTEKMQQAVCTETDPHPVAEGISEKYEVPYDQVMEWFCAGAPFEDILLALETHKLTELPVEQLLERAEEVGWDQLWAEVGLIEGVEAPKESDL